jgi:hypothetical protein
MRCKRDRLGRQPRLAEDVRIKAVTNWNWVQTNYQWQGNYDSDRPDGLDDGSYPEPDDLDQQ